jgi:hypothetical protein
MRYSGRDFSEAELEWLKAQIANDQTLHRTALSKRFCEQFNWRKANGSLKDVSCRVALLRMERDGLLTLPTLIKPGRPVHFRIQRTLFCEPQPERSFKAGSVQLQLEVIDHHSSKLWNEFIDRYHYLGHQTLPGAQLRYFVLAQGEITACLGFGASAWKVAPRDSYIGWSIEQREQNLHLVINNARFLILPWIKSYNLGSRILSLVHRCIASDWERMYNYRPVMLETFVEKHRFSGTVYKASNWICVGETTGRGKKNRTHRQEKPIKSVWLFPLVKNFRQVLCGDQVHEP